MARRATLAAALATVFATVLTAAPAHAAGPGALPGTYLGSDTLLPGYSMVGFSNGGAPGSRNSEYLLSANGHLQFFTQADSNMVVYADGVANWTVRRELFPSVPPGCSLVGTYLNMQSTGNLAFIGESRSYYNGAACTNTVLWQSGTYGHPYSRLVMQNDGNLVIYDAGGHATWSLLSAGSSWWRLR